MRNKKENIIFTASHLYLFWTTGVYYVWELSKKYNVILFVEDYYKKDKQFQDVCKYLKVYQIIYYKKNRNTISSHYNFNKLCKKIVSKFSPKEIFHYNHEAIWNQYLSYWSSFLLHNCINTVYINGHLGLIDSKLIANEAWQNIIDEKSKKYFIPKWLLGKFINTIKKIKHYLEYYLLPFIILGHNPMFQLEKKKSIPFNTVLCYQNFEKNILNNNYNRGSDYLSKKIKVKKINHPVETIGKECNEFLYGSHIEDNVILMPSLIGFNRLETELPLLNNWIDVANIIKRKFQNYKIQLKLHPGSKKNPDLHKIQDYLRNKCSDILVMNPSVNSQKLICGSKVIVSDTSSVLWWANFIKNKTLISIDFHNFVGSDQMKYYKNIYYFEKIEKLKNYNFLIK
jgi:hypothetical protein